MIELSFNANSPQRILFLYMRTVDLALSPEILMLLKIIANNNSAMSIKSAILISFIMLLIITYFSREFGYVCVARIHIFKISRRNPAGMLDSFNICCLYS